jgi:hypothetical protein
VLVRESLNRGPVGIGHRSYFSSNVVYACLHVTFLVL